MHFSASEAACTGASIPDQHPEQVDALGADSLDLRRHGPASLIISQGLCSSM